MRNKFDEQLKLLNKILSRWALCARNPFLYPHWH